MYNAVFDKTMESLGNRVNVHLVMDPVQCQKLAARPTLQRFEIINTDLELARPHIVQTKPIYVGFCILELSKVTMYESIMTRSLRDTDGTRDYSTRTQTRSCTT